MSSLRFIAVFLLLLITSSSFGRSYNYNYTENCSLAYRSYMALELPEGNAAIVAAIKADPYNLLATFIADYDDFVTLMFNGNERELAQRRNHFEQRLRLLEKGDPSSPMYRLCKGGLYLHWAIIHARFGENFKAATQFRKSYLLLRENKARFPSCYANNVFLGLQEAVIGTIPEEYKWVASILGMKGNVNNGIRKITEFINGSQEGEMFREEAITYQAYLRFYLQSQQQQVWNYISSSQYSIQGNLFRCFVRANLALNSRHSEAAIQTLHYAQSLPNFNSYPSMDYELGNALLLKLDYTALNYYQRFLSRNSGKLFTKDCLQKMAFAYYLHENYKAAEYYRAQILVQGTEMVDADKQAARFANAAKWPHPVLLKAHLLTDGGFYLRALALLATHKEKDFKEVADKLEFNYQLGRVYDELDDDVRARQYYEAAIHLGKNRPEQFAARAALQMGVMNEKKGLIREAINYYEACLGMRDHDFQSSLDQQAKAGLNRLSQSN